MSQTLRTMGAVVLGAAIVAVAALSVRTGPAVGAPTTDTTTPHTITVTGTGTISIVPDIARVGVGVTVAKSTVRDARAAAAASMSSIIAALKGLGIDDKDLQTTSIDLSPRYASGSSAKIIGYTISEQLQVTVRDLDKAGDVVDTATAKGANEVNGLWFDVSDPAKAQNDARQAAVAAARSSAQALASAGGVTLGSVISIADSSPSFVGYGAYPKAFAADAATPVQPGSQDLTATVTVVFELD